MRRKGLSTQLIAFIVVIATLTLSLFVFSLYALYFSNYDNNLYTQSYIIGLSKGVQVQISPLAFKGIGPAYNYFNVSYLVWVSSPTKYVTVVVFNTSLIPLSELFYELPQPTDSGLFVSYFTSSSFGYKALNSFYLHGVVYLPQSNQVLGYVSAKAFNITANSTYVISSIIKPSNAIVIWVLYSYEGKWYRLDFTYTIPSEQGLGVFIVTKTGAYYKFSKTLSGAVPPHYVSTQTGDAFGLWFKEYNSYSYGQIVNFSVIYKGSIVYTVFLYVNQSVLYVKVYNSSFAWTTRLYTLTPQEWYFVNFSTGSHIHLSHYLNITVYNAQGNLLNYSLSTKIPEINQANISVIFGSNLFAIGISQAVFTALQSTSTTGLANFYNVTTLMLKNGYYYNNTYNYEYLMLYNVSGANLYSIIYWYFVYPYSNAPSNIPALMLYYPNSFSSKTYSIAYIYEIGTNTYSM